MPRRVAAIAQHRDESRKNLKDRMPPRSLGSLSLRPPKETLMRRTLDRVGMLAAVVVLFGATALQARDDHAESNWFTAWSISIGHRMGPAFSGANFAPDVS